MLLKLLLLLLLLITCCGCLLPCVAAALPLLQEHDYKGAVERSALQRILDNTKTVVLPRQAHSDHSSNTQYDSHDPTTKKKLTFPLPCSYMQDKDSNNTTSYYNVYVQESTTSLLAAKALSKTVLHKKKKDALLRGRHNRHHGQQQTQQEERASGALDNLAWDMLDAALLPLPIAPATTTTTSSSNMYFQAQGLLPKYWYVHVAASNDNAHNDNPSRKDEDSIYYVEGTKFPHWSLFTFAGNAATTNATSSAVPRQQHRRTTTNNNRTFLQSSHRLSALPLHASILWDMLCAVIPPQHDDDSNSHHHEEMNRDGVVSQQEQQQQQLRYENLPTAGTGSERQQQQQYEESPHESAHVSPPYSYNYDQNRDWWNRVERYYNRIYQNHAYIHQVVMRGCSRTVKDNLKKDNVPCYNILHPWESLMDPTSPTWRPVLQPIMDEMQDQKWTLPFDTPNTVKEAYDYPPAADDGAVGVYEAMIYLLVEGWNTVNLTDACSSNNPSTNTIPSSCGEDAYWNHARTTTKSNATAKTKFAMLDVGYAAILAQADADLHQLARVLKMVLPENFYYGSTRRKFQQHLETIEEWQQDNQQLLQKELWNARHGTYQSKFYNASSGGGRMEFVDVSVSNNLIPFWNVAAMKAINSDYRGNSNDNNNNGGNGSPVKIVTVNHQQHDDAAAAMTELTRHHWKDLSLQLIRRDDRFAFDCGLYPLWSQGCAQYRESASTKPPIIQPIINYLIANGLLENSDNYLDTFGRYLSAQSLKLFGSGSDIVNNDTDVAIFGDAYSAFWPYQNLATLDRCGHTSTLTAAIIYNLKVPDPSHVNRLPLPPIRRSWVITLITVELFLAFSIGVSCLVLSFSLMRKTSMEDEERTGDEALLMGDHHEEDDENGVSGDPGGNPYYDATAITSSPDQNNQAEEGQSFFGNVGLN